MWTWSFLVVLPRGCATVSRRVFLWEPGWAAGLLVVLMSWCVPSAGRSQQLALRSQPVVESREEFLQALDRVVAERADNWLEAALVATAGEPGTSWALEIAQDSVRYTFSRRAAALMVLGYARFRPAIPILRALSSDVSASPMLWPFAATALAKYPYPELAPFWRGLLAHPNPLLRHYAVFGLAASGEASDTLLIRSVRLPNAYNSGGNVLNRAVERLRRPATDRDSSTFGASPAPDGRFIPSQPWIRDARNYLCGTGRCPRQRP